MIIYEYDPKSGGATPDGLVDSVVNYLIAIHNTGGDPVHLLSSTENVLHALRVAVKLGRVSADDIEIRFGEKRPKMYRNGGIRPWPHGFADYHDGWHRDLLNHTPPTPNICRICGEPVSRHRHPPVCDQQVREEENETR